MSEPQPSNGAETNAARPATAGLESLTAVGGRLAQLREAKGWSVDDVSARLKVAQKLRALEAGDISHLPGVTFALGVVRSYAKMLGVDPEPFAQALRRERGVPEVDLSMPASSGTDLPRGRVSIPLGGSSRHRPWLWGAAAAVVAMIAAAMWHTGGESSNWLARFKAGGAQGASAVQAPVAAASAVGEASAAGASAVAVTEASAPASAAVAAAPQMVASAAPAASTAPATPVEAAPVSQPVAAVPAASVPVAAAAQPASVVVAAGQSMVELKVKQDCWFSVRDKNGKELFSSLVRAGETKQVAGDGPLKVTIGNKAGLDAIAFDGKPVDPAKYSAARGNVARFTLP